MLLTQKLLQCHQDEETFRVKSLKTNGYKSIDELLKQAIDYGIDFTCVSEMCIDFNKTAYMDFRDKLFLAFTNAQKNKEMDALKDAKSRESDLAIRKKNNLEAGMKLRRVLADQCLVDSKDFSMTHPKSICRMIREKILDEKIPFLMFKHKKRYLFLEFIRSIGKI